MPKFPAPQLGDPDFVFENAIFLALADPAARRLLEVLRRGPCSIDELSDHVGTQKVAVHKWMVDLIASKLVVEDTTGLVYRIDPAGLERLRRWLDRFLG